MHRARVAMACVIALLAALMPLLVVGQVRYFDPVIDVPSIRFPLDDCVPYYPPPSEGGGIGYNCSYSTMGRVAVIGRAGHLSGTQLTTVWNQHFVMSGRDARYLRYNFGPYCKLEQVACGAPYYAECGIESTYNRSTSCNQRMCLRAVQSYLGACRITVELNPDASCTSTSTGMLWNHQANTLILERDFNFVPALQTGQVIPRGMDDNKVGSLQYFANPRACLYTCVATRDP